MGFVVVHHVRRNPTILPSLLSSCTEMPVEFAAAAKLLQPDHVHILPAGKELYLEDGCCSVRPRSKLGGWPNVLTIFLESLTKSRHRGVAVILCGLDADGAAALKSFKESGGITIVQDAASAKGPQMPTAALKTGAVDFVLAPEESAAQLEAIANELRDRVVHV